MTKFLFVTDLDNTLVGGDDSALEELNQLLSQHRQEYGSIVVYSTGRSRTLYNLLRTEKTLIEPDALVLSVGTEIYLDNTETLNSTWIEKLSHRWDRDKVVAIGEKFDDLSPQPQSEQGLFKISYFLSPEAAVQVVPCLEGELKDQGIDAQVIYSGGEDLDILPRTGNKGAAMLFLQQNFGLTKEQTVVCGDSGNDLAFFQTGAAKGVIVGNARSELLDWHYANPSSDRYLAQAQCAGGILEGLRYFGFLNNK